MTDTTVGYDVAISFLKDDLALAQRLRDGLSSQLTVFVYVDRQEELAGTDGLETFRNVFRHDSRLVVVLFRTGWGETSWTRVEQQAITDRFLKEGPDFLFFLMVDSKSDPPPWLPEQRIRFSLEDFGIEQAIGAIKLRVRELGGRFRKESVAELAIRSDERAAFNRDTSRLLNSEEGVRQATESALSVFKEVERFASEASNAAPDLHLEVAKDDTSIGIRTPSASISIVWHNRYSNVLEHSYLIVALYRCKIILPGENRCYIEGHPKTCGEYRFLPERVQGLGWCWKNAGVTRTPSQLAEHVVVLILDQVRQSD